MDDYSAYRSDELAELYDAVYTDCGDEGFWRRVSPHPDDGPLLELGCGTGRALIPLAHAGHTVTGLDIEPHMLARCRAKLERETAEVRERVSLVEGDMTTFALTDRFAQISCPFGTFHHLRTVEAQVACLERCRMHVAPGGRLVLDLINPDPASADSPGDAPLAPSTVSGAPDPGRRRVTGSVKVVETDRVAQCNVCEATYEILEEDGTTRRVSETFPIRFVFRWELEHLLYRCGFRIAALYGDYDLSPFAEDSPGMLVVATRLADERL